MTDDELIAAFESTELPAEHFSHEAHVRVAWWYLRDAPLPAALTRFETGLRRFARVKGAPHKYHQTITVAYMLLIRDRLDGARDLDWPHFASANPDLLNRAPSVLSLYYSEALLASDRARVEFVLPDRAPGCPAYGISDRLRRAGHPGSAPESERT